MLHLKQVQGGAAKAERVVLQHQHVWWWQPRQTSAACRLTGGPRHNSCGHRYNSCDRLLTMHPSAAAAARVPVARVQVELRLLCQELRGDHRLYDMLHQLALHLAVANVRGVLRRYEHGVHSLRYQVTPITQVLHSHLQAPRVNVEIKQVFFENVKM